MSDKGHPVSSGLFRIIATLTIVTMVAFGMLSVVLISVLQSENAQDTLSKFAAREKCARDITERSFYDPVLKGLAAVAAGDEAGLRVVIDGLDPRSLQEQIEEECPKVP